MRFKFLTLIFFATFFVNCQQQPSQDTSPDGKQQIAQVLPIVGWGDSMMGGSGTKHSMTEYLKDYLNRETKNFGVGGITSEAVAILQGGRPFNIHVENNKLPSRGRVKVTNLGIDPINKQTSSFRKGEINGVQGVLERVYVNEPPYKTIRYEFERDKPGSTKQLKDTCVFKFTDALQNRSNPIIIWVGRNDQKDAKGIDNTIANIQSMLDYLAPTDAKKKVLILSVCNGSSRKEAKGTKTYNETIAMNQKLNEAFGEYFVDVRSYLINDAMKELGLEPTEEDLKEIAADCIPASLRSDPLHLNDNGNKAVAKYLSEIIQKRKY